MEKYIFIWMALVLMVMSETVDAIPVQWPVAAGGNDHYYEPVIVDPDFPSKSVQRSKIVVV